MTAKRINFPNFGGDSLCGIIDLPDGRRPRAMAVMVHCFTCHKNYKLNRTIAMELNHHGIGVFRIDLTGLGDSQGFFAESNFSSGIEDIQAAHDALVNEGLQAPSLLVGHSLGGTMAIAAACRLPSVMAVATLNAPFDPLHLRHHFSEHLPTINATGYVDVSIGGKSYRITRQFIADIEGFAMKSVIESMDCPLLILHAPDDRVVNPGNASRLFATANKKNFIGLDGMDHLLSGDGDAAYVGRVIAAWSGRYIGGGAM